MLVGAESELVRDGEGSGGAARTISTGLFCPARPWDVISLSLPWLYEYIDFWKPWLCAEWCLSAKPCGKWGFKVAAPLGEAVPASSLGTDGRGGGGGGGGGETSPPSVHCPRKGFKSQVCRKEEMWLICSGFEACRSLLTMIPFCFRQVWLRGDLLHCQPGSPSWAGADQDCSCSSQ